MKLAVGIITVMVDRNSEEKLKVLQHRFNLLGVDCSSEEFSKFSMPKILNKRGNDRSTNLFINGPVNAMCVNVLIRIFYTISRSDLKLSLCSNGVNLEIP